MQLLLVNALLFVLLILAAWKLSGRVDGRFRTAIGIAVAVISLPAVLFSIYYLHFFDNWSSFYQFRSFAVTNYYPAALGIPVGWLLRAMDSGITRSTAIAMAAIFVVIPFAKPVVTPLDRAALREVWRNGVCIQSTPSTCGPANVATILSREFKDPVSERMIAQAAHTTATGTEVWYLAQFLRARGYEVSFHTRRDAPLPHAIAGTRLGAAGHFVAVLACINRNCQVADPLTGRIQNEQQFAFTGLYMQIRRTGAPS